MTPPPSKRGGPHASEAASTVLMVRPQRFFSNPETAASNAFQRPDVPDLGPLDVEASSRGAAEEFERLAAAVRASGVRVVVVDGARDTPDALFPNNWVSFHRDGTVVLYPMLAPSRRREVRPELVEDLRARGLVSVKRVLDLRHWAELDLFLEGTGSLVLDRRERVAYACLSPRTCRAVLDDWSELLGYRSVTFRAVDRQGRAIYHTNVMMGVGTGFAVVCAQAIGDPDERAGVLERLRGSGRVVVELTLEQMEHFAGNLIELRKADGGAVIVLSAAALASLEEEQRAVLREHGELVPEDLTLIEALGGGSARCMIAEAAW